MLAIPKHDDMILAEGSKYIEARVVRDEHFTFAFLAESSTEFVDWIFNGICAFFCCFDL